MKLNRLWLILSGALILLLTLGYLLFFAPFQGGSGLLVPGLAAIFSPAQSGAQASADALLLSPGRQAELSAAGTWAALFPPSAIQNRSQVAAVLLWWVFITLLGWLAYPLVRKALPGLADHGYPFARLAGLLLLAYPAWLAGSLGRPVTPGLIAALLGVLALISLRVALAERRELLEELRANRRYFLWVELIAAAAFLAFLLVRLGNPDLWHVIFGGEKPMDFSYFNAVLKSDTYPPYDPWFAGGVMNYYYYGFVIVGIPVKLLGITPSVAYNLILPALYSLVILGAFSIGWNLNRRSPWLTGACAALGLAVLGNLGAVRMVWQGWQRLVASQEITDAASIPLHIQLALLGAKQWLAGAALPYSLGDWYWIPSRAVIPSPGGEITEFPLFTFLYADLHAHLIALPVTLLVIAWAISVVLSMGRWGKMQTALWGLAFGALAVGTLRAANSWDHPTYLILSGLALGYALVRGLRETWQAPVAPRLVRVLLELAIFIGLSFLFYEPFNAAFKQGYTQILPWSGDPVNLPSYLTHWGLFLFILTVWLFDEVIDWMAHTPLSALRNLQTQAGWIGMLALFAAAAFIWLIGRHISAALFVVPLGIVCALLLFRPGQPDVKRVVLFMVGSGLALTLAVELIALQGDRMNTIFKFYYQAWTLLALSAAAGLAWLAAKVRFWAPRARGGFGAVLLVLALGCAFTTLMSTKSKIQDRMADNAPHTLDGMAYIDYASMLDGQPGGDGKIIQLAEDARAIRWMQQNVQGSPVILEAHTGEYRHWGTRFTIYTGLPGVIGWEAHQHQQRSTMPGDPVADRVQQVNDFYMTTDRAEVETFLQRYQVKYIILGQLERLYYPGPGLDKFQELSGILWKRIYQDGDTEIYQVSSSP